MFLACADSTVILSNGRPSAFAASALAQCLQHFSVCFMRNGLFAIRERCPISTRRLGAAVR